MPKRKMPARGPNGHFLKKSDTLSKPTITGTTAQRDGTLKRPAGMAKTPQELILESVMEVGGTTEEPYWAQCDVGSTTIDKSVAREAKEKTSPAGDSGEQKREGRRAENALTFRSR